MKLIATGLVGVMISAALSMGCAGLSHRAKAPEPSADVFASMDAELSRSVASSTTVTSAEMPAMNSPVDMHPYDDGAQAEATAALPEERGASPAAEAVEPAIAAPAAAMVNEHPYD